MNAFAAQHEQYIRALYKHNAWPMYTTIEQCLDLIDEPTFNHGITLFRTATGLAGDANDVAEDNPKFYCAHKTIAFARASICKWPDPRIRWHTKGGLPGVTAMDFKGQFALGLQWWMEVCGVRPEYTSNEKTAHLLAYYKPLDRKGSVLAQSEMPCSARTQNDGQTLHQHYDGEDWGLEPDPTGRLIYLAQTSSHENGHGIIGTDHIPGPNLMAAMYNPRLWKPQAGDIAEGLRRYPLAPVPVPPPPVPVPTPAPPSGVRQVRFDIDDQGRITNAVVPGFTLMRDGTR